MLQTDDTPRSSTLSEDASLDAHPLESQTRRGMMELPEFMSEVGAIVSDLQTEKIRYAEAMDAIRVLARKLMGEGSKSEASTPAAE